MKKKAFVITLFNNAISVMLNDSKFNLSKQSGSSITKN